MMLRQSCNALPSTALAVGDDERQETENATGAAPAWGLAGRSQGILFTPKFQDQSSGVIRTDSDCFL